MSALAKLEEIEKRIAGATAPRCFGCEDRPFGALWAEDARPHTCAKAVAGAAPKPAPAPCQHRELMAWADQKYISDELPLGLRLRIKAALNQPCQPAQGEEWEQFESCIYGPECAPMVTVIAMQCPEQCDGCKSGNSAHNDDVLAVDERGPLLVRVYRRRVKGGDAK